MGSKFRLDIIFIKDGPNLDWTLIIFINDGNNYHDKFIKMNGHNLFFYFFLFVCICK